MSAVIEKLLVEIEGNVAQLQAELAKGTRSVQSFEATTKASGDAARSLGDKYARAGLAVAGAAEGIARTGNAAGGAMKTLVTQGANLAFAFGTRGPIIGAVTIALVAIVELFRRSRDEAAKLSDEMQKQINRLKNTGDAEALVARARTIFRTGTEEGTPETGLDALRKRIAAKQAEFDAAGEGIGRAFRGGIKRELDALRAQAAPLEAEFRAIQQALTAVSATPPPKAQPIQVTASDPSKAAAEREREAAALRDLSQAVADLEVRARSGDLTLRDFDRSARELGDTFRDKIKTPTEAQARAFDALSTRLQSLRVSVQQTTADKLSKEFAKLKAELTTDALDDFLVALQALQDQMRESGFAQPQIDEITRLMQQAREAQKALEQAEANIRVISDANLPPLRQAVELQKRRAEAENELNALTATGSKDTEKIAKLKAVIAAYDAALVALGQQYAGHTKDAAVEGAGFAAHLEQAAQAAFGVSTALLGADHTVTKMLGSVLQIASGLESVSQAAKEAGGLGALFSSGSGLLKALPGIGGILGGVGALGGLLGGLFKDKGETPEQRALREAMEKNSARLVELRAGIEELTLSLSGAETAAIRDVPLTVVTNQPGPFGPIPTENFRRVGDVLEDLRKAGVSLDELRKVAADFGITLSESPAIAELEALQDAIKTFSLKQLTESLDGQLRLLEIKMRIDPAAFDGIKAAAAQIDIFAAKVPAIGKALEGIDLTTAEGQQQAIDKLKALLEGITSIDLADFGALKPEDFPEAIARLIEALRKASPAAQSAADQFASAMDLIDTVGGLDASARLQRVQEAFRKAFGEELFAGLDFANLDALKASIQTIKETFDDDGALSEQEKALADALGKLLEAAQAATPALQTFADALGGLEDLFDVLGTSAADQLTQLLALAGEKFPALLDGIADDLDLSTEEGRAQLRARLQELFRSLAEDGVSADEEPIVAAIKRLLRAIGAAGDAAKAELDAQAAEIADRRRRALRAAEDQIKARDIEDPIEQLIVRFRALQDALPGLAEAIGDIDVSTQEGREALDAWIQQILATPDAMQALADQLGLSVDDLIGYLLDLEDGLDRTVAKVASLGDQIRAALSDLDFDLELRGITDPIEKLRRSISALGEIDPRIAEALNGIDVSTAEGRAKAIQALQQLGTGSDDQTLREEILTILRLLRGVSEPGAGASSSTGVGAAAGGAAFGASAATITEVTANRLVDFTQRTAFATERISQQMATLVARMLGGAAMTITPPALPFAGGGSTNIRQGDVSINLHATFQLTSSTGQIDFGAFRDMMERQGMRWLSDELARSIGIALQKQGYTKLVS